VFFERIKLKLLLSFEKAKSTFRAIDILEQGVVPLNRGGLIFGPFNVSKRRETTAGKY